MTMNSFLSKKMAYPTLVAMVWFSTLFFFPIGSSAHTADTSLSCIVLGTNGMGWDKIIDQIGAHDFEKKNSVPSYIKVTQGERAGLIFTNDRNAYFALSDLELGGRFPIRIIRTYNGDTSNNTGLGYGWHPNSYRKITTRGNDRVLRTSSSQTIAFSPSSGYYYPPSSLNTPHYRIRFLQQIGQPDSYVDYFRDGSTHTFEEVGDSGAGGFMIVNATDRNDNELDYYYDDSFSGAKLTKIENEDSNYVIFYWNGDGDLITKISDTESRDMEYYYDTGNDLLTQVKDVAGNSSYYYYDGSSILTKSTDQEGNDLEFYYDGSNYVTKVKNGQRMVTYDYDDGNNRLTYIAKPLTGSGEYKLKYLYDGDGRVTAKHYGDALYQGQAIEFSSQGNITSRQAGSSQAETFEYATSGANMHNLTKYTDPDGNVTTYEYDSSIDKVTSKVDPLSIEYNYYYDSSANLTKSVSDVGGLNITYEYDYDSDGNRTKTTDPLNNTIEYVFSSDGYLTKSTNGCSKVTEYLYDTKGNRTYLKNPLSVETESYYDDFNQLTKKVDAVSSLDYDTTFEYNDVGNMTKTTDANGNENTTSYDSGYRITARTDCNSNASNIYYDFADQPTKFVDKESGERELLYGSDAQLTKEINELDCDTIYYYSNARRLTKRVPTGLSSSDFYLYEYDNAGHLTKTTDPNSNSTYNYLDANGRLTKTTDARGKNRKYWYDNLGRRTRIGVLYGAVEVTDYTAILYDDAGNKTKVIDPESNETTSYYNSCYQLTKQTDPLTNDTTYDYDDTGRQTMVTQACGTVSKTYFDDVGRTTKTQTGTNLISEYQYDNVGNRTLVKDALGNETTFEFDCLNRLTNRIPPSPYSANTTTYEYDKEGRKTKTTKPDSTYITYDYDALGNQTKITDAIGNATTYLFDCSGKRTGLTNALSNTTQFSYDKLSRLTSVTDALSNSTSYYYDENGNRTRVTDARSKNNDYLYDNSNRLTRHNEPADSYYTTYEYDKNGNRTKKIDPASNSIYFYYDGNNRLTKDDYPGTANDATYSYNACGLRTKIDGNGDLDLEYYYDTDYNRLTKTTYGYITPDKSVSYDYNDAGRITKKTGPESGTFTYLYDNMQRLTKITDPENQTAIYEYSSCCGQMTKTTYPNSAYTTYLHDDNGKVTSLKTTNSTAGDILDLAYYYNGINNRTKTVDNTASITYNYYYDDLSRLTGADESGGANDYIYEYDDTGNITRHDEGTDFRYYYNDDNRLTGYTADGGGVAEIYYDENGNVTASGNSTWLHDVRNRMTKFDDNGNDIIYYYYPDGTRASRKDNINNENEFKYVNDKEDVMVEYEDVSGTDTYKRRYTHGPGIDNPVKLHLEQGVTDKDFAYHPDALGSVRALTDSSKGTAVSYTYKPYGFRTLTSGTDSDAEENRYGFTAREFETDYFSYYRSRYYGTIRGAFFEKDTYPPIYTRPLSINGYFYVEGNPINMIDPHGFMMNFDFFDDWQNIEPAIFYDLIDPFHDWENIYFMTGDPGNGTVKTGTSIVYWAYGTSTSGYQDIDILYRDEPGWYELVNNYSDVSIELMYDWHSQWWARSGSSHINVSFSCPNGPYYQDLFEDNGKNGEGLKYIDLIVDSLEQYNSPYCVHHVHLAATSWRSIELRIRIKGLPK